MLYKRWLASDSHNTSLYFEATVYGIGSIRRKKKRRNVVENSQSESKKFGAIDVGLYFCFGLKLQETHQELR